MDTDRDRLKKAIDDRAFELRLTLKAVAERAHMSEGNLFRIRNGQISLTRRARTDLEHALEWEDGHLDAYATTVDAPSTDDPSTHDETEQQIAEIKRLLDQANAAMRKLERGAGSGRRAG